MSIRNIRPIALRFDGVKGQNWLHHQTAMPAASEGRFRRIRNGSWVNYSSAMTDGKGNPFNLDFENLHEFGFPSACVSASTWKSVSKKIRQTSGIESYNTKEVRAHFSHEEMSWVENVNITTDVVDDGGGLYRNLSGGYTSFPAFMILHDDGENAYMIALPMGFDLVGDMNKTYTPADLKRMVVEKLCDDPTSEFQFDPAIFVINKSAIRQPQDWSTHSDYRMQFGQFVWLNWSKAEAILKGILGADGVYDLMHIGDSTNFSLQVHANELTDIDNIFSIATNWNQSRSELPTASSLSTTGMPQQANHLITFLDLCADRITMTHTISTTEKIKQGGSAWIPSHADYRGVKIIDKTGGGYAYYSDYFRCQQCNIKVIVKCGDTNREDTAPCPQCKTGEIKFPHLVKKEGVE
jgi:hypothetical protein